MRKGWDVMKQRYLTQINELIDLCTGNFCEDIQEVIKEQCKNISDEDAEELKQYVEGFVKCCIDYGDILASEFKVPFLLRDDESERKIRKYIEKCKKEYPAIEEEYIERIFSTVCWLANR